jgi:hypothetical protein
VPDTDPYKQYADTRTSLRDTAKWIVTIVGATVVLVIGGGLIAKIADLDLLPRLIASGSLLALAFICMIPLKGAIDIVATRVTPLREMVESPDFATARQIVDAWMDGHYDTRIDTVGKLYNEYRNQIGIANDARRPQQDRDDANGVLQELQPRIREIIELTGTEQLRLKFDSLLRATLSILPIVGFALFIFLMSSHKEDATTEKQLAKPVLLQLAWSADIEDLLKKGGMPAKCFAKTTPRLLQISEKSGLRAGVLAIPHELSLECPAVRVVVTNANTVYLDN